VTAAAEAALRSGHPWLFADSIRAQNRDGELGELAVVYDRRDRFLALGLYEPGSALRVRVLHAGKPQTVDPAWWAARLERAVAARRGLLDGQTTGFRCLNGESDGWPGLVLDRYDQTLVLKLYTAAWLPRLDEIAALLWEKTFATLQDSTGPARLVLRLSRNIQPCAAEHFGRQDGTVLLGAPIAGPVVFLESGLRFEADVVRGQKTGFFLDQRENRRRIGTDARGRAVLNAFSFSGGFSLYAARGGARSVTDLDLSAHALAGAERNFGLNHALPAVAACRHERVQADAFEWLAGHSGRRFDLVVLDPPSLAKRESERAGAIRAYARLAELAIKHLNAGGLLLACSCSAHVTAGEFFQAVRGAAGKAGPFEVLHTARHAPDHPATFSEAEYLKAIYLQLGRGHNP